MLSFIKKILSKKSSSASSKNILSHAEHQLPVHNISPHCLSALKILTTAGFEAYLVGGSVRDLLLGREPKDFDVATSAKPEEVRKLFRNCRLIGKRFRLAHLYYRDEIIEVATFRKQGKSGKDQMKSREGLLKRDNVYGTLKDDVWRRDFTINALYYDAKTRTVIDFTEGLEDLKQGLLRVIGKPELRYREDPVRILRAIRFSAKLGMSLEAKTAAAIAPTRELLKEISNARLFDETIKLFSTGSAVKTFASLRQYQLLQYLYPSTEKLLQDPIFHLDADRFILRALQNTDKRVMENKPLNPAFLVSVFLWYPLQLRLRDNSASAAEISIPFEKKAMELIQKARTSLDFTHQITQTVMDIWSLQFRLEARKRPQIESLLQHHRFRAAYDFLCLRSEIEESLKPLAEWWTDIQELSAEDQLKLIQTLPQIRTYRKRSYRPRKPKAKLAPPQE